MDPINKSALRVAVLIHEQLVGGRRQDPEIHLPEYAWNNILQIRRRIGLARQHGWHRAALRLNEDLPNMLDHCHRDLENACQTLQFRPTERQASSASEIYRDILSLHSEFEEVDIDLEEHTLSVTTDRIVLQDVHLGDFDIRLDWRCLGRHQPYRVVALHPHPAAKSADITHPHVQDGHLCEGEGRTAIQAALEGCRLFDFFLLVSQVLHTYGRGSAYVELHNWYGVPCEECGTSVDDDDRYYCHHCDSTLCGSCAVPCENCGDSYCSGCISKCAGCDLDYCSACLKACPICRKRFCDGCLEEGDLCRACDDKQRNEEKKDDPAQKETQQRPPCNSPARRRRRTAAASA
jgi:hypothetical protein